jgi:PST family polysaccharide transporter
MTVLLQQGLLRALVGIKFLLIARLLGPAAVGTIGIALLVLAISEAVSDTGLNEAIVQRSARPSNIELGATWSLLILRGLGIGLVLAALAPLLSRQFHVPEALPLLLGTAAVPVIRGLASPCVAIWQRDRQFSRIAMLDCSMSIFDFTLALTGALCGMGVYAVLGAMIFTELLRSTVLLIASDPANRPNLQFGAIRHYARFSRWIWADSVANGLLLNQFDRIVVGKWFGPTSLGVSQMTGKLSQMLLFDPLFAASLYLFPTFSAQYRRSPAEAYHAFRRYPLALGAAIAVVFVCVQLGASIIITGLLGPSWASATPVFRLALISSAFRGLGTVLTAYLRATNRPRIVTQGLAAQIGALVIAVPVGGYFWGLNGVIAGLVPGAFLSTAWMLLGSLKPFHTAADSHAAPNPIGHAFGEVADN